jgi:outer membrane protein assembly factor BamA
VSFPLSWGGTRRAAVELERGLGGPARVSLGGGLGVWQQEHPHFDVDERRTEAWVGATLPIAGPVRVEPRLAWASVRFDQDTSDLFTAGADLVVDTRLNPALPRNAVNLRAGVESVRAGDADAYVRAHADLRGYVGLVGTSVLAVRGRVEHATAAQPPYLQPWLGGSGSVRGLAPGRFAGDRLVMASAELRVPLGSPLSVGTLGLVGFADVGAVGPRDQPFASMAFTPGAGAGVFLALPLVSLNLDLAHAFGHGTRLHVSTGVRF